jgi:hypothetical protein
MSSSFLAAFVRFVFFIIYRFFTKNNMRKDFVLHNMQKNVEYWEGFVYNKSDSAGKYRRGRALA